MEHNNSFYKIIHLLTGPFKNKVNTEVPLTHCEHNAHHDFYCEAERPFPLD
ncbi:hypothetical protein [Sediminicola luteus]|jgi:hypothetical protein|uniref:hypothetical protein n=1 Tax=Sediminicola luteus TaxID=319238 RepID=UPI001551660D|nr:hypothetical protein [Sediminicola luteus]